MKLNLVSAILAAAVTASASPVEAQPEAVVSEDSSGPEIFLIRHAEKNADGTISDVGMQRAQCIANIFGPDSSYNIQKIIVQTPHAGSRCCVSASHALLGKRSKYMTNSLAFAYKPLATTT